jgi:hypothetical protein
VCSPQSRSGSRGRAEAECRHRGRVHNRIRRECA